MVAMESEKGLCVLEFVKPKRLSRLDRRLGRWFPDIEIVNRETPLLAQTRAWLEQYFDGVIPGLEWKDAPQARPAGAERGSEGPRERTRGGSAGAEPPGYVLDMRGNSFERQVWRALLEIQPGRTTTYGAIAKQLGSEGASRAVGAANGANPIAIIVPCHRVIGHSGSLTGYGGGLDRKSWLLDHERRWGGGLF
jgi:O-6-methylguanine DNA methyltransferase